MLMSTDPEWLSLLVQPFSLLLIPGLLVEMALSNPYTFHISGVLRWNALLYFVLFAWFLHKNRFSRSSSPAGAERVRTLSGGAGSR